MNPPEFTGSYSYHVDEKGRTKLPAPFTANLGLEFIATRGLDGCIWLLPHDEWRALLTDLLPEGFAERNTRRLQRIFIGGAVNCSLDRQGRLAIPTSLRDSAGVESEIIVAGMGRHIEIWARDRWTEETVEIDAVGMDELLRKSSVAGPKS